MQRFKNDNLQPKGTTELSLIKQKDVKMCIASFYPPFKTDLVKHVLICLKWSITTSNTCNLKGVKFLNNFFISHFKTTFVPYCG
jgi:hypothetical protein